MRLRRPSEPARVRRVQARIDAWLAAAVGALTLGTVVGLEIGLARELRLDRVPGWLPVAAGVAVFLLAVGYGRRLLIRLHHDGSPRWRLTPTEGSRLLPNTAMAFWFAGGFASYSAPWEWAITAVAAFFVGNVVLPPMLRRLSSRRPIDVLA